MTYKRPENIFGIILFWNYKKSQIYLGRILLTSADFSVMEGVGPVSCIIIDYIMVLYLISLPLALMLWLMLQASKNCIFPDNAMTIH